MADIYAIALQFRAALLARDRAAAARLIAQYGIAWTRLRASLDDLIAQIEAARLRGETPTAHWLAQQERYRTLLREVESEVARLSEFTHGLVTEAQRRELERGATDAHIVITAAGQASGEVNQTFNRLPKGAVEQIAGTLGDGSPLARLLAKLPKQAGAAVGQALVDGVALGENPVKVARRVRDAFGGNLTRAMRVTRTEMIRAYRESTRATYDANSDRVMGWQWLSARSLRTCAACWALDGQTFDTKQPMGVHPNCIPAGAVIHAPKIKAATSRWYDGPLVEFMAGGNRLSVTPNHPILTARGWIAADLLNESDYVVCADFPERMIAAINPDKQEIPAPIEQVFRTLMESRGMLAVRMPSTPEYFHGDGKGGEIDIINIDGQLSGHVDTSSIKPLFQDQFIPGDVEQFSLSGLCVPHKLLMRRRLTANSIMRGSCIGPALLGGTLGNQQPVRGGLVANLNLRFLQSAPDRGSADIKGSRESIFRFARQVAFDDQIIGNGFSMPVFEFEPRVDDISLDDFIGNIKMSSKSADSFSGFVKFDQVRQLRKRDFSGHVYNLETVTGWYIANGIITHNCRCTQIPVLKDAPPFLPNTGEEAFAALPPAEQAEILGPAKFAAYSEGKITLRDLVVEERSAKWGVSRSEGSLRDALAGTGGPVTWGRLPTD